MAREEILGSPPTTKRLHNYTQNYNPKLRCVFLLLASSLALNAIFAGYVINIVNGGGWSREAAEEAERVGATSCSGHGSAFVDGVPIEGVENFMTKCECYGCYAGPDCSKLEAEGCVADADSGNPLFLEPFWRKHAASSAVVVSGWHRMSYLFDKDDSLMSHELDKLIRKVHSLAGNALTQGKFIVFGAGSAQLLNAAVHAMSSLMLSNNDTTSSNTSTVKVVASFPFYPMYQSQTDFFKSDEFEFRGNAYLWRNNSDTSNKWIEFVTSPNNPDCQLNKAVLRGPSVRTIYDHAYYWPHYTPIPSPSDEDLMIFTLSKLTGHAGSRFGWALIKDEELYKKMLQYVKLNIMGVSHDTQLRAMKLLKVVVEKGNGREIFEFAHDKMRARWERLNQVLSKTERFSLQHIPPQFCSFLGRVREASPAYAWLRCNREEDTDCSKVMEAAGIICRPGIIFGIGEEGRLYVRLSLLKSQDDFELLMEKIEKLVSVSAKEDGLKTM